MININEQINVTPFVGVWIETLAQPSSNVISSVTPFVGVWIETRNKQLLDEADKAVTPFVGVWIETE